MNKLIGVLFDIDGLGGSGACEAAGWRILMTNLDLREMPNVVFYQGELDLSPGRKPRCFCIAISDFIPATGGRGCRHFVSKMETVSAAGLYPEKERFLEGDELNSLTTQGKVDAEGCLRMSVRSGDLGNLTVITNGRELGWKVLPGEDLIPKFAMNFLARKSKGTLDEQTRKLCETLLKEVGYDATMAAMRGGRLPAEQLQSTCEGITALIWPGRQSGQSHPAGQRPSAGGTRRPTPRKWWEIWKKAS